jgi:hypothetical protein
MERGDEKEEEELASPGSGAGDKDGIFGTRGGGRGPRRRWLATGVERR